MISRASSIFLLISFCFLLSCSLVEQFKKGDGHSEDQEKPPSPGSLEHVPPENLANFDEIARLKLISRDRSFEAQLPNSGTLSFTDIQNLSFDPEIGRAHV